MSFWYAYNSTAQLFSFIIEIIIFIVKNVELYLLGNAKVWLHKTDFVTWFSIIIRRWTRNRGREKSALCITIDPWEKSIFRRKENANEKEESRIRTKSVSPSRFKDGGLGRPTPPTKGRRDTKRYTHLEYLVGRRVHAQPALQHRVPFQLQQTHVQTDDGRVGLGPEDHFHFAAVRDVVFGHRPVAVAVQLRVQKHLVALRLHGQKRYLVVRDARVISLLYQRITIYVLNNDNTDPISVHVFSLAYIIHVTRSQFTSSPQNRFIVFTCSVKKRKKKNKRRSFVFLISRLRSFEIIRTRMKNTIQL